MARWTVVLLLVLAACKGKDDARSKAASAAEPPPPAAPVAAKATEIGECALYVRAAERFLACPAAEPHHATFRELRDRLQGELIEAPLTADDYLEQCLHGLVRIDTRGEVAGCDLGLGAAEKQAIAKRRTRRTPPPAVGTQSLQAFLRKLAADRDRACACADDECANSAGTITRKDLHPDRRSPPVRAAHDAILAELGDCRLFPEFRDTPR